MSIHAVLIGAGNIGRAMAHLLQAKKDIVIDLWDKDLTKIPHQKGLADSIPDADFVIIGTPSWAVREVITECTPYLNHRTTIISLAKGIEEKSNKTIDMLLTELLPKNPYAIVHGPLLAHEIMENKKTAGVVATRNVEVFISITNLFSETYLTLEHSSDMRGVAINAILKNIYAMGLGIIEALNLGKNIAGWFITKALEEMNEISILLGGQPGTAYGLAGLGDLVATGLSPHSYNHRVGKDFIITGRVMMSEGSTSLPRILTLLGEQSKKFLLLQSLKAMLIEHKNPKETFDILLG